MTTKFKDQINLLHGSADNLDSHISSTETYDYIVSIDSAYHYNTRWDFLKSALTHLKPTGSIGLYDLCIDPNFLKQANALQYNVFRFICQAVHIPIENLVTTDDYEQKLMDMGYKQVHITKLDRSQVFGGLSGSFERQYYTAMKYGIGVSLPNRMFLKISSFLFGLLATRPWLVPVIVKGEKEFDN